MTNNKTEHKQSKLVLFYHDDPDGWTSGYIANKVLKDEFEIIAKIPIDYHMRIEDYKFIYKDKQVVLLDFLLKPIDRFRQFILDCDEVLWIDHHKDSEEMCEKLFADEKIRDKFIPYAKENALGACTYTYKILNNTTKVPFWIKVIGYYDVWQFPYGKDFHLSVVEYMQGYADKFRNPDDEIWKTLASIGDEDYTDGLEQHEVVKTGKIFLKGKINMHLHALKTHSFVRTIEGKYKGLCVNCFKINSIPFEIFDEGKEYDLYVPFFVYQRDNKLKATVFLYTQREDIDVSTIANKYGGGGHKEAAGFQIDLDELEKFLSPLPRRLSL